MCKAEEWRVFQRTKVYNGSSQDLGDGFIHLSTKAQIVGSAKKHRSGQDNLILLYVDVASLGEDLRWESSRGRELFPHLYGTLNFKSVLRAYPLLIGPNSIL